MLRLEVTANGLLHKHDAVVSGTARVHMCMSGMCAFTFGDAQKVSFSCRTDRTAERQRRGAGGRGLGVVLHLGWSVSHCGKTQYLHFVIRTTFTLSFSTTRIYAHLTGKVAASGLMTCTCSSPRDGQVSAGCVCVCVWERWCCGENGDAGLVLFMKVVLCFESCAPDVMAESS